MILRIIRGFFWSSLLCIALAGGAVAGIYYNTLGEMPDVEELKNVTFETPMQIFSSDGLLIGEFGENKRIPVDIKDIPVDECSDGCVKLTFNEDLDEVAEFFKWKINKSKMSNITDLITKVIQISEVNVNQKLSFKTMYYTEDFGWMTGKEIKNIWKSRNK